MAVTLDINKSQSILTALKGVDQTFQGRNTLEHTPNVFVNFAGEIIIITSAINHKTVGKVINDNRFQIGRLEFDF